MDGGGLFSGQSLQALSALLSPQEEDRKDPSQVRLQLPGPLAELALEANSGFGSQQKGPANLGPGHIGPQAARNKDGSFFFSMF